MAISNYGYIPCGVISNHIQSLIESNN